MLGGSYVLIYPVWKAVSSCILWAVGGRGVPKWRTNHLPRNKLLGGPNAPLVLTNLKSGRYGCDINSKRVCPIICLRVPHCLYDATVCQNSGELEATTTSICPVIYQKISELNTVFVSVPTLDGFFTWL